jgi:hypothetical protein
MRTHPNFEKETAIPGQVMDLIRNRLPDLLLYVAAGSLLVEEILRASVGVSFLKLYTIDLRVSIGIAALLLFVMTISIKINNLAATLYGMSNKYLGVVEVLQPHETLDFPEMLERSKKIRLLSLSGTKAASLGDAKVRELLMDPQRASEVVVLLANPFSEAIIGRYKCDEPESFEAGPEGIMRRLVWLYEVINKLPPIARKKIDVRVYNSYPVVSILQADRDMYSTSYGYKLRGGDCPKVHSDVSGEYGKFLRKHFEKVYADSQPLEAWVAIYKDNLGQYFPNNSTEVVRT